LGDDDKNLFDRLRERGEEVLGQISGELMQNEHFMKAMQGALAGKEHLDRTVGRALKTMNVPTRSEVKRAVSRIEALEAKVAALEEKLKASAKSATKTATKTTASRPRAKKG
jgi:polyhydroxyalkanoate synthesis regulator phasin